MKHLRKAFSTHRLIRSQPDGTTAPVDNTQESLNKSSTLSPDPFSRWQRRKPRFNPVDSEDDDTFITLWDENSCIYEKKI